MNWRIKKQLIYGFFFLGILILLIGSVILIFKPKPSCFDNKQNQNETGIDCGGPCLPCDLVNLNLISEKPKIIIYPDNTIDLIAKIKNPSPKYGLRKFEYEFILTNKDINAKLRGKSFIMPLESKYLLAINLKKPEFEIQSVDLKINFNKEDWVEIQPQETKINLLNYILDENNKLMVEIINSDEIPYSNVEINFIIFDIFENIIGTAKTYIDYLEPSERKNIIINLPPITKEIERIIIAPYYNFFQNNEN